MLTSRAILLLLIPLSAHGADGAKPLIERYARDVQPLFAHHCAKCHGPEKKKGEILLPTTLTLDILKKEMKMWEAVREQVGMRTMPPPEAERAPLKPAEVEAITRWAEDASDFVDSLSPPDPGYVALHRLNRAEYNNTIRDLVGVDFKPADSFPADDSGYGFDNIADVLTMSPLLAEKYLEAAEQVMDRAILPLGRYEKTARGVAMKEVHIPANIGVHTERGEIELFCSGDVSLEHPSVPQTEYEVRITAYGQQAGNEPCKMVVRAEGQQREHFSVENTEEKPRVYTHRFTARSDNERVVIGFLNDFYDEKVKDPRKRDRNLFLTRVEINGPLHGPPPAMKKIFFVQPPALPEADCAKQIVQRFASRAFRRPASEDEVKRLLNFYKRARGEGGNFERGIKAALTAALVSPHFLFRVERKPEGAKTDAAGAWALSSHEIAARLSYFLWSTMPDDELSRLADEDKLRDPAARETQVRRMLRDGRAKSLVSNFAGQWLELRNLEDVTREQKRFPMFDGGLAYSMRRETEMFFENIVKEDRSVLEFINADYTFLDDRLAKLYGLPPVGGGQFKKVSLTGSQRGGVLTMASVLTITSNPNRTSPVKRGKWVLTELLGTPPPPAPPNVPQLSEKKEDEKSASLRQRLENHRTDPNCAACHTRMDGIGFSLERYDAIGRWREKDGEFPIDDEGSLPGAPSFRGVEGLKQTLLARKQQLVRNLSRKMMTYALGRGVKSYDRRAVEQCVKQVENSEYRFSSLVLSIINSDPFLKRRDPRGDE